MGAINFNHAAQTVTVTADNGASQTFDMATFLADEIALVASVGNGIAAPVPPQVSRLQGVLALHDAGLLDTVNAIVAQSDARTQLAWNSTPDFHRDSAALNAIWGAMGKTQAELDELFRTAANIAV